MRLFLLPISTRRTLIYCQRINKVTAERETLVDKATTRASRLWLNWEKADKGWKKSVTAYGNKLLERIPYEEWALKSVPPLSARRKQVDAGGQGAAAGERDTVDVVFPPSVVRGGEVMQGIMRRLATDRQGLHRKRLIWSVLGMPITAPVALIPIIPNIPFFYLVYRAWSHWRALSGSKHLEYLLDNSLITPSPTPALDAIYASISPSKLPPSPANSDTSSVTSSSSTTSTDRLVEEDAEEQEVMVLDHPGGKAVAEVLDVPELNVELSRAITQVSEALQARAKSQEEDGKASPVVEKSEVAPGPSSTGPNEKR
ncbi:MAG: hypothetical protein M4579_005862 [Chaenotheca gracillima]|nr:MAG: hypothetical protein M4579_005862 [Chaenotheca gracillima]